MNSSAMPLLVDHPASANSNQQQATSAESVECMSEIILRRPIAIPNSVFCMNPQLQTHPYDRQPTRPTPVRIPMVPRNTSAPPAVIAELLQTVTQARERKRQREEAAFTRRCVGQQTELPDGTTPGETAIEHEEFGTEAGISQAKRVRREEVEEYHREGVQYETVGTNTTPPPPSPLPHPSSTPTSSSSSSSTLSSSSTSSTLVQPSTSSDRLPDRLTLRRRDLESPAARQARRAQRHRRQQAETLRIQMEHHGYHHQQIAGLVPGNDHNCTTGGCPNLQIQQILSAMNNQQQQNNTGPPPPPPTGPHAVSPTLAPGALYRGHHTLATPAFPFYPLTSYHTPPALNVQMIMGVVYPVVAPQQPQPQTHPIHAPVPVRPIQAVPAQTAFHNVYSLRGQVGNVMNMTTSPYTTDYFTDLLRHHNNYLLPTNAEGYAINRHHMFQGIDIDVPVGASKADIDNNTIPAVYTKKDGDEEEETCTVCLSNFEDGESIQKLPCNHIFHPECIYKWLDINKRCPMCREEIDKLQTAAQCANSATAQ